MPQLDPAPWFMILVFSWLVFATVIPPKVIAHAFPNEPTSQAVQKPKKACWNWPWY
nr:ATP synthase F0 subunit 8 [Apogon quadrisquamatus]